MRSDFDALSRRSGLLLATLSLTACVTTQQVNIGTKTSLEKQLVGELEPLSEEELLAASVRARGEIGLGSLDELQSRAISARRRQLFNRDDVDELKAQGCLGEGRDATLQRRPCEAERDAERRAHIERLVAEENADRRAIIDWALASDSALTPAERPQVVGIYRRLLLERARAGDWIESDEGVWAQR